MTAGAEVAPGFDRIPRVTLRRQCGNVLAARWIPQHPTLAHHCPCRTLDRISHERKVLDVLRELTRIGLHEGDELQHRSDGTAGRLLVLRASAEPGPVVVLGDGAQIPFRSSDWRPRP
jgi:hypothetical protein